MDSKIDYNNYKADSLLNDAYFLESEQHPTPESIMFWDKLAQENKQSGRSPASISRSEFTPHSAAFSATAAFEDSSRLRTSSGNSLRMSVKF